MEFREFGKIPRLNRACTITEKIDGTNASIMIDSVVDPAYMVGIAMHPEFGSQAIYAGSRTRWITPGDDNYGFAAWVKEHAEELVLLGPGHHFGEWWGRSINRGYGLNERRFSLFNTSRWSDPSTRPACCGVVPVLYEGLFDTGTAKDMLWLLQETGSHVAPGYMDPEGIVVYHHAANSLFKATIKGDDEGKHAEAHAKKERPPRPPRDPSKGGRRKGQVEIAFPDRRKPR